MKRDVRRRSDAKVCRELPDFFEHAVWGIFQTTEAGRYLAANTALAQIYGYDSVEDLLRSVRDIAGQLYVDPARRTVFIQSMRDHGIISEFESEVYRRDGTVIWISESCREVRTSDGRLLYYEGSVEDISRRKRIEADLHAAKEEAEQASRAKTNFLAHMGHELRTPLNAVIGFSQLIINQALGPVAPGYGEYARFINDSGNKLLSKINDVLQLVALESRELVAANDPIPIHKLISVVVAERADECRKQGLDLLLDIRSRGNTVIADPPLMRKVLNILLSNAIGFTGAGGRVVVSADDTDEAGLAISITDTGCGIAETDIRRICAPFAQTEALMTRRHEGMGIGLAIAKVAIELHEGSLLIRSELGAGTEVTIKLPPSRVSQNAIE